MVRRAPAVRVMVVVKRVDVNLKGGREHSAGSRGTAAEKLGFDPKAEKRQPFTLLKWRQMVCARGGTAPDPRWHGPGAGARRAGAAEWS